MKWNSSSSAEGSASLQTMEANTEARIRALELSLRRQRYALLSLSLVIIAAWLYVARRPAGNANFEKVTCRKWVVVDPLGIERIVAGSTIEGHAGIQWYDEANRCRMSAVTSAAGVMLREEAGDAAIVWYDKSRSTRISAGLLADGSVALPTEDLKK